MARGAEKAEKTLCEWRGHYKRIAGLIGLNDKVIDYPTERLQRIYQEAMHQMAMTQIAVIDAGFDRIVETLKARR